MIAHSYDGGDQGFLILYFAQWHRLPFFYNAIQTVYLDPNNRPAWDLQRERIRAIHFMEFKPWKQTGDPREKELAPLHAEWWRVERLVSHLS